MAALNFPDSPATGDLYGSSGTVWRWDGARWASTAGASGARGRVAYAYATANQGGFTTMLDIAGLSVTWVADPTRFYRITVQVLPGSTLANDSALVAITTGAGVQIARGDSGGLPTAAVSGTVNVFGLVTGISGSVTYKAMMQSRSGGTITNYASPTIPSFILVEDITYEAGTSGVGIEPTAWTNMTLSGGFTPFSGWGVPQWRYGIGRDRVEMRGMMSMPALATNSGGTVFAALPPPAVSRIIAGVGWLGSSGLTRVFQYRVGAGTGNASVTVEVGDPAWSAGSWCTLDNVGYTL